ncbi:MAG TPA: hypothetical protein VMI52_15125 [Acetobacteraceae bacterium]|nr:hypothetical protein [Acetobacteraceae bacterium]
MDEKAVKALADMLALVVDDNEHISQSALLKVRQRARQDGVTGGALKNLVSALATRSASPRPPEPRPAAERSPLYGALCAMQAQNGRLLETQAALRAENRQLRFSLSLADLRLRELRREYARLAQQAATAARGGPWRFGPLVWGPALGLLAGALLFHLLVPLAQQPESATVAVLKPAPARLVSLPAVPPGTPFLTTLLGMPLVRDLPRSLPPAWVPSRIMLRVPAPAVRVGIPSPAMAVEMPLAPPVGGAVSLPVLGASTPGAPTRGPAISGMPAPAAGAPAAGAAVPSPLPGASKPRQRRAQRNRAPHGLAA